MEKTMVTAAAVDAHSAFNPDEQWEAQLSRQLVWIKFWQTPWMLAHSSWLGTRALPAAPELEFIAGRSPQLLRRKLNMKDSRLPKPDPALLNLVMADFASRMHALLMVTEVVKPGFALVETSVDSATREWCRRLAKALRPGTWPVVASYSGPLMYLSGSLLRQWVTVEAWARLKLLFNRQWIEKLESVVDSEEVNMPAAKLNQLWQAVIWRAGLEDRS